MIGASELSSDLLNVQLQLTSSNYTEENIKREFKCSGCKRVMKTLRELVSHLKVHRSGITIKFYKEQALVNPFDDKLEILEILSKNTSNIENNTEGHEVHQIKKISLSNKTTFKKISKDPVERNQSKKSIMNLKYSRCKICNKYLKRKGLAAHIKNIHGDIKQRNNTEMNPIMVSADINNNVTNEVNKNRSKNRCNVCNKTFKKGGMSLHILKSHKNKKQLKLGKKPKTFCSNKSENVFIADEDNGNDQRCMRKLKHQSNSSNFKQSGTNIKFENIYSSQEIHDNSYDNDYLLDSDDNSFKNYIPKTSHEKGLCDVVEVDSIMYSQEKTNILETHVDICELDIYFIDENSTDCISISEDIQVSSNSAQSSIGTGSSQDENELENSIELGKVMKEISSQVKLTKENLSSDLQNKNISSNQNISIKEDINDNKMEKVSSVIIVSEFVEFPNTDMPFDLHK